jgi:hypothetical protein
MREPEYNAAMMTKRSSFHTLKNADKGSSWI